MSWYWQKDLRKNGDTDGAWEAYSSEDNAKLEKAYQKGQKTMKLSSTYKIDFAALIQFRAEDRSKQRAIKREEADEADEKEEDKKAGKKVKKNDEPEEATPPPEKKKKTITTHIPAKKEPVEVPKKIKLTTDEIKAIIQNKGKERTSNDFYVTSGAVVCGNEHDIFEYEAGSNDAPSFGGGTVAIQPTQNENGYTVKKGKWTFFQSNYIQACYHESVDASFINADYLGKLSQTVFDEFPNFWKGAPEACMDFRLCRKIGRYDWGMNYDAETGCTMFHFVDKSKADELVKKHNILGDDFWGEVYGMNLTSMTEVWSGATGGGVCWHPAQEYRYGYFCTNKDAADGNDPTLFVVYLSIACG